MGQGASCPAGGGWSLPDEARFWKSLGVWGAINSDAGDVAQLVYRLPDGKYEIRRRYEMSEPRWASSSVRRALPADLSGAPAGRLAHVLVCPRRLTLTLMSTLEMGFVRLADGLRLRYRLMPADGPTVLLLHGWPQTGHAWRRVMPTLAASGYLPLAPDLRGMGDSDKPIGGYDA